MLELSGQSLMFLNGGPDFQLNPSISLYTTLETREETDRIWNALIEGGSVMMPIDEYPWSPRYGWLRDKFGLTWQITQGNVQDLGQKFCPSLMFTGKQHSRAEEAVNYYTQVFPDSKVRGIMHYEENDGDKPGTVKHAQYIVDGFVMMAMDSGYDHGFQFNEAVSLVIRCEDQAEIDRYWNELTGNGGKEGVCGWLTDRFGVSWQTIPANIGRLLADPARRERVLNEIRKMKKIELEKLEEA